VGIKKQKAIPTKSFEIKMADSEMQKGFLRNRVKACLPAWAAAGAGEQELSWLREGFRLPWLHRAPTPFNRGISLADITNQQHEFLTKEFQRMFNIGALEKGMDSRFISRAFLVPKPGQPGKWRMVFDLRHVNSHLRELLCRMETLKKLQHLAQKEDYMFSIDLEDGFYCVPIHKDDRKFLTFNVHGFGLIQFAALPMGLSNSPYVFTKVMRTFVRAIRSPAMPTRATGNVVLPGPKQFGGSSRRRRKRGLTVGKLTKKRVNCRLVSDLADKYPEIMKTGVRMLPYMDDFLFLALDKARALILRDFVSDVLGILGLSRNEKKGVWEPTQALQHLGLGVDSGRGLFFVPPTKLKKLQDAAKTLICRAGRNKRLVPARDLASFTGLSQSVYLAVPPARFFNRAIHDATASRASWKGLVRLPREALRSLDWFAHLPDRWNGHTIWRCARAAMMHCDASKKAWGAILNWKLPARGFWRAHQRRENIALLELRAVRYAVESFLKELQGKHVTLREDNQVVIALLVSWTTRSPALMRELRKLFWLLDINNIRLYPKYIRSAANWWADALSRMDDDDDWKLHPRWFKQLDADYGPHTIDRFATANNRHLERYNSAWGDPMSEGVDCFTQDNWETENNFCNPPWELLQRLADLLRETGAEATVVAPYWPAEVWFQQLNEMCSEVRIVQPERDIFLPGKLGSCEALGPPNWPVAFFRIPGSRAAE